MISKTHLTIDMSRCHRLSSAHTADNQSLIITRVLKIDQSRPIWAVGHSLGAQSLTQAEENIHYIVFRGCHADDCRDHATWDI